jgi:DNA/RNA-binding domain of Phe-tRNA-synthetase-like protein
MLFKHTSETQNLFNNHYTGLIANVSIKTTDKLDHYTNEYIATVPEHLELIDSNIKLWKSVYEKMGAKPKYCSSVESLKKYFDSNGKLYKISPIVDFYNAFSLCNGIPMAAYDQKNISGDLTLRLASKDELFVPLGNPKQIEKTKNNEVIYADSEKVICRYWNLQDCHQTRITPDTSEVLFIFDIIANGKEEAENVFREIVKDFQKIFGDTFSFGITGKILCDSITW